MKPLYQIFKEYDYIKSYLEEEELTEDIENQLFINRNEVNEKINDYVNIIELCNNSIDNRKKIIEKLKQQDEKDEILKEKLKFNILLAVKSYGVLNKSGNFNHKTELYSITQKENKSIVVADINLLPVETLKATIKTNYQNAMLIKESLGLDIIFDVDKIKLKPLMENCEGAYFETKESIAIK